MLKLVDHEDNKGHNGNGKTYRDHVRRQPVILFALVENEL